MLALKTMHRGRNEIEVGSVQGDRFHDCAKAPGCFHDHANREGTLEKEIGKGSSVVIMEHVIRVEDAGGIVSLMFYPWDVAREACKAQTVCLIWSS